MEHKCGYQASSKLKVEMMYFCVVHTIGKLGQNAILKTGNTDQSKGFLLNLTQSVREIKSY